ncbi:MAG: glycosyltransferase family 2 protein [Actinobacteria bacterium]|nr:MAG: glycosyltransferase family 2 protein [Actinomycetota bacterium]
MSITDSMTTMDARPRPAGPATAGGERAPSRPMVSVVVPAYNEAAIIEANLAALCGHMESLEDEYRWEIVVVDDGSTDQTGPLAEAFSRGRTNVRVLRHVVNFGLGQALRFAFNNCRGEYILTMDVDLSYSPDHIRGLLTKIRATRAKVVVASPYMKGGHISNVPWLRRMLSVWANRFLSATAKGGLSTLTSMVRVYDARFVRGLNLRSMGMEISPEVIYKAMLLRARIEEIPADLDWRLQNAAGPSRKSSMKVLRHTMSTLLSGFLFKPFMFFIIPGFVLLMFSLYVNVWMLVHFFEAYQRFPQFTWFFTRASAAVATAYQEAPHTFLVGLMSLTVAIQLISLGILALQSKRYFEEIFHLGTTIYRSTRDDGGARS